MPSLNFVLPHWLYWAVLILFPLIAIALVRRQQGRLDAGRANLFLAYLFLVTTGFIGMHRFYLKNAWGLVFIPVFLVLLWTTGLVRDSREDLSRTRAAVEQVERLINRAKQEITRKVPDAETHLTEAEAQKQIAEGEYAIAQQSKDDADSYSRTAAIILALMLVGDAFLLPRLVRRVRAHEGMPTEVVEPPSDHGGVAPPPVGIPLFDKLSKLVGEYTAYWAVIAVFAYYCEVIGRYVFNSPTNWVHESMFLMFGMQYMLAGAYAYRDETHVRVDILYSQLGPRGRAICDLLSSSFFFLFTGAMLYTGWRFAADAISYDEHSFTEWGIQYWPVKLTIPIGAALLILQGLSRLVGDIALVMRKVPSHGA